MPNSTDTSFSTRLISPILKQLERIALSSRGEQSLVDLKSEAWIAAQEILEESEIAFEPEDERLQDAILARLRKAFGRFANRMMRFAIQLDQESVGVDGDMQPNSVGAGLAGPDAYEPDMAIERAQEREADALVLSERFAEAVAYLQTFENFGNDGRAVAAYLAIPITTLRMRLQCAELAVTTQPSMFDSIETIARDFTPLRGRRLRTSRADARVARFSCVFSRPVQLRLLSSLPAIFGK